MAEKRDPYDGDYIGNIFGWRISLIGLVVMVVLGSLIAWRHYTLDVPVGFEDPLESREEKAKYAPESKAERERYQDTLNVQE